MVKKKRQFIERTRGGGTLTEAQFWAKIRAALRNVSRFWKPIQDCKKHARRPYKGKNKRLKWEYKCSVCGNYFPEKKINVDHTLPVGTLKSYNDLPGFVERLFVEEKDLTVMCENCHLSKTKKENEKRRTNT